MVLYCFQCTRYVPWVNLPEWRCRICKSVFIDEIPDDQVSQEIILRVRQERDRNIIAQSQRWNQQRWNQPGPSSRNYQVVGRPMRFPLPPPPPRRVEMFVTPDGRIVPTRQHANMDIPTEREVERRRSALRFRPYNPETDGENLCSVCLDEHSYNVATIQGCKHVFHQACMERWLEQKNECPLCKVTVAP
jgi:hypothetical protein